MNDRERRYSRLLWVYPARYRSERGDEILATLLEASSDGRIAFARDTVDIVMHGTQVRLGLSADRFAGRVLTLAALPGLMMAAALSIVMFVFGELLPIVTHGPIALRFGPFWTIGPLVYLVWLLGASGALLWPRHRRPLAIICVLTTVAAIPVGNVFFARPNLWELLLLVGLGLPAVLAPGTARGRYTRVLAAGVGLLTLALLWLLEVTLAPAGLGWFPSFYWWGTWRMGHDMPYIGGVVIAVVCILLVVRQVDAAGAVAILSMPFLMASAAYPYERSVANSLSVIAAAALAAWFVIHWILDLKRLRTQHVSSA